MPRGRLGGTARQDGIRAMRFEQLCVETRIKRLALREQQRMDDMRRASPDWVDLDGQLKQAQLESEMDAMEAAIDAGKPHIPILNFDLMPEIDPPKPAPEPDKSISANENKPPRPNPKGWAYPGTLDDRDPADDWRNYE